MLLNKLWCWIKKKEKIDHKDVLINANKSKKKFNQLIIDIIQNT